MGPGSVAFLVGDATRLPIGTGAVTAATAVDALVYLPDREAVFTELARVLADGGVVVCSDLVAAPDLDPARRATVERFAAAWDMPPPGTARSYREGLSGAGFERVAIEDITAHSVGRFRKWTRLYRGVRSTPVGGLLDRWLEARGIDPDAVGTQIDRAHEALPALRHVLVVARRD